MVPENAGYGGDSTTSMLVVAQIPLSSRRTSAYPQMPAQSSEIQSPRRSITRTCRQTDGIEQITWNQQTKWATTRRWTPRDAATRSSASPTPHNSREPAELPMEAFSACMPIHETFTQARTQHGEHTEAASVSTAASMVLDSHEDPGKRRQREDHPNTEERDPGLEPGPHLGSVPCHVHLVFGQPRTLPLEHIDSWHEGWEVGNTAPPGMDPFHHFLSVYFYSVSFCPCLPGPLGLDKLPPTSPPCPLTA